MIIEAERRRAWARGYLGCEDDGEPAYQEIICEHDLIHAMEAEAKHWAESRVPPSEITPDMLEVAERQAEALRERGIECTAEEVALASFISNMVESTTTLNPDMSTKATRKLGSPEGLAMCLILARCIPLIREAESPEQMAAALNQGVTPVLAAMTKKSARDLSRLVP
jgi:hypothetical protein